MSVVSSPFAPNNGDPLFLEIAIATQDPMETLDPSVTISGCAPSWAAVPGGSLSFGSTGHPKGYIAYYSGTSNNDGQCTVTVTLEESAAASLKIYDVPGYNGHVDITSSASGSYVGQANAAVYAQSSPVTTTFKKDLMLGTLLQVNQRPTPLTWWEDWLTNSITFPTSINCFNHFCPADDGTDYLPGHGPYSSNVDAGHHAVGPTQSHALQRAANGSARFDWGGVAIYVEITNVPLAVQCPSSMATVGTFYASPVVTTGGAPDYNYTIVGLPPGLNQLEAPYNPNIYGIPTTANSYPYTIMVTDAMGTHLTKDCTITVTQ
jgi:hypothetical protein